MWPFKRKISPQGTGLSGPECPNCGSTNSKMITHHGTDSPGYIKVWRGHRYVTFRCLSCSVDFYAEDAGNIVEIELNNNDIIDDLDALRAAEDELKKQVEEEDNRMFR